MRTVKIRAEIYVKARIPDDLALDSLDSLTKEMIKNGDFVIKKQKIEINSEGSEFEPKQNTQHTTYLKKQTQQLFENKIK